MFLVGVYDMSNMSSVLPGSPQCSGENGHNNYIIYSGHKWYSLYLQGIERLSSITSHLI